MSRSWQNLPYEVLFTIFENLDQTTDISICQRTCQSWSRAARERLYKEVTLYKFSAVHKFLDSLLLSKRNCSHGGEEVTFGQLVKSLELKEVPNKELRLSFLDAIADLCPHLQQLKGQWNSALWHGLLQQHAKGHLQHLQVIELPIVNEAYGDYVAAVLAYRNAIKSVFVLGDLPTMPSEQRPYTTLLGKELIKNLGTFSCLTGLEIKMEVKDEENIMALEHMIDHCQKTLKIIKFTCYEKRSRGDTRVSPTLKKRLALVQQHPNIQKLHADGIYITDECIDYLEHKFPHLQQLVLNDLGEGFDGRVSLFELSTTASSITQQSHMGKFFQYLKAIPSFQVYGKVNTQDLSAMMNLYTTILDKNLHVKIQYSHHRPVQAYPFMILQQKLTQQNPPSKQEHIRSNNAHFNLLEANYLLQPTLTDSPPHAEFLTQFGENMRELYLKTGIDERHEILHGSEFEVAVMSQTLPTILTHCPHLESLTLEEMNFVNKRNNKKQTESLLPSHVKNKSIKRLTIRHSNWYAASVLFPQLAMALPSLRNLVMDKCALFDNRGQPVQEASSTDYRFHHQEKKSASLKIVMPNIEFESITITQDEKESKRCCGGGGGGGSGSPLDDTVYVKLDDQHGSACYIAVAGNTCPLSVPTKIFDTWTDTIDWFYIHCKTLKSFHFNEPGSHPITFHPSQ